MCALPLSPPLNARVQLWFHLARELLPFTVHGTTWGPPPSAGCPVRALRASSTLPVCGTIVRGLQRPRCGHILGGGRELYHVHRHGRLRLLPLHAPVPERWSCRPQRRLPLSELDSGRGPVPRCVLGREIVAGPGAFHTVLPLGVSPPLRPPPRSATCLLPNRGELVPPTCSCGPQWRQTATRTPPMGALAVPVGTSAPGVRLSRSA